MVGPITLISRTGPRYGVQRSGAVFRRGGHVMPVCCPNLRPRARADAPPARRAPREHIHRLRADHIGHRTNGGHSEYNSLQLSAQKRFSQRYQLQALIF